MAMLPVFVFLCTVLIPIGGIKGAAIARVLLQLSDCVLLFAALARVTGRPVRAFLGVRTQWTIGGTAAAGVFFGFALITWDWSVAIAAGVSATLSLILLCLYRSVGLDRQEVAVLGRLSRRLVGQRPAPELN